MFDESNQITSKMTNSIKFHRLALAGGPVPALENFKTSVGEREKPNKHSYRHFRQHTSELKGAIPLFDASNISASVGRCSHRSYDDSPLYFVQG
jgi:hypothetical protein